MKIALAQLNYHIGFFDKNLDKIKTAISKALDEKADLIVFSELAIGGYPPQDLLFHEEFLNKINESINAIASFSKEIAIIAGTPYPNPNKSEKPLINAAVLFENGKVREVIGKQLLPNYDVFDELRYFEPVKESRIVTLYGKKIALTICEDLWSNEEEIYTNDPMEKLAEEQPDVIINIAASPFDYMQNHRRQAVMNYHVKKHTIPGVYVNQVGAHSELIFDGGSFVINKSGQLSHQLPFFSEQVITIDLENLEDVFLIQNTVSQDDMTLLKNALVLGIRDFFEKNNFKKALLGLSGGLDSALTLVLAVEALGKENVLPVMLPSAYSSNHSISDSEALCNNLGVKVERMDIHSLFENTTELLHPFFKDKPFDIAEENIQSRLRGLLLMALSNKLGCILLNTTNKSEAAVGYGTLYGDLCGAISVLGDVYKTQVFQIAKHINRTEEIIPGNIITKPPSAELRADQKDTDSLPEYDVLDKILHAYIEEEKSVQKISAESTLDKTLVERIIHLVNSSEFKRYQMAPVLRVSPKGFGVGRRFPLVAKY